ncbi:MAG: hypothetical protein A2V66_04065 [Ignavibacteria bacterium RBG_13_36_8]|nr:MAG: hypothetical protein A2V66_04065 [Ignavibacteria bacterium RBG_13_36_8]
MGLYNKIAELNEQNKSFVIATVVKISGSVPGKVGFKMIVEQDGTSYGTVGGGAIEQEAIKESLKLLSAGEGDTKEYILSDKADKSEGNVIPMSCSGKVWIYYEVHAQNPTVYVFGGGHVGNSLLHFLSALPYHTILIDNREEFAHKNKNPQAREIILSNYQEYVNRFSPKPDSYYVILTHGHTFDYQILQTLYKRNVKAKYIGVIASKSKAKGMIEKLKNDVGDKVNLSILHTPVGIKLGGDSASEIALCIAAEIQSIHYAKSD